jgi:hypothetical protein
MNKRQARRNLMLAGLLILASVLVTSGAMGYIRFIMGIGR